MDCIQTCMLAGVCACAYMKTLHELKWKATQVKLFGMTCETNRKAKIESYVSFLSVYDQPLADANSPGLIGLPGHLLSIRLFMSLKCSVYLSVYCEKYQKVRELSQLRSRLWVME